MKINNKVCKLWVKNGKVSPLCNDWAMYDYLSWLALEKGLSMEVMIWITYAESHIGTNFAPSQECSRMNNWWWVKAIKYDNGKVEKYKLPYQWCWLYPFKDMKEFWRSLANTLSQWYVVKWCDSISCVSKYYVWERWPIKPSRVNKVSYFINYKM